MEENNVSPIEENHEELEKKSQRAVTIAIGLIVLIIAVFVITQAVYDPKPVTMDDLFEDALKGKLSEEVAYVYNGYVFIGINSSKPSLYGTTKATQQREKITGR